MMLNPRQERFAQLVASGLSATEALVAAGYSDGYGRKALKVRAHQLRWHPRIADRIEELMAKTAESFKYTRQWLLEQLEAAMIEAGENKHSGARVSALSVMARILGEDKTTIRDERDEAVAKHAPDLAETLREFQASQSKGKPDSSTLSGAVKAVSELADPHMDCEGEA